MPDEGGKRRTRYPDGSTEQQVHDEENNLVATTDRAGRTTRMVYDAANRLIETIDPDDTPDDDSDNPRTRNEYDAAGRLVAVEDARGFRTTYAYDAADRKIAETNALGQTTSYVYDARGLLIQTTDALGRNTKYVYDAARRLIETIHPDTTASDNDNRRTRVQYDALGRKTQASDELNRQTRFEYDALGRMTAVIDPANQRTEYDYDETGSKLLQRDALGRETRWSYDDGGRMRMRTRPLGQVEHYTYDAGGQLTQHTDFNGATTTTQYDASGRPTRIDYADGHSVVTTYTPTGQVASRTDRHGTTGYQYDARDRLIEVTHPDSATIAYDYDAAGNRTRLITAHQDVAYTHDELGRLASVSDAAGTTTYGYTAVGSRSHLILPSGARTDYTYNVRNRLTNLVHRNALGATLLSLTYTLDASGLRTRVVETGHGTTRTVNYQYDALRRLTSEQVTHSTLGHRTSTWTYDAVGNRLTQVRTKSSITENTSYSYDGNDRLLTEVRTGGTSPGVTAHVYDANGSLIESSGPQGLSTYEYDGAAKLIQAVTPTSSVAYTYDATGIRQSQSANGHTTRFLVDPNQAYAQVIEERDTDGDATAIYTVGDDRIAQQILDDQGGLDYHAYHADGLGSTRLLTDASGQAVARLWYEAFGETEAQTGAADTAFRYTGEQLDPNLGWYYLRARYMDPTRGRFTQMDPFAGFDQDPPSLHKYLYAHASPTYYTDPSGNFSVSFTSVISLLMTTAGRTYLLGAGRSIAKKVAVPVLIALATGSATYLLHQYRKRDRELSVIVFGSDFGEATAHYYEAITDRRLPAGLSRKFPVTDRGWYRSLATACTGKTGQGTEKDCDEYPFLSTKQGGPSNYPGRVSLKPVNSINNQAAGRFLLRFYNACNISTQATSDNKRFGERFEQPENEPAGTFADRSSEVQRRRSAAGIVGTYRFSNRSVVFGRSVRCMQASARFGALTARFMPLSSRTCACWPSAAGCGPC